MGLPYKLTNLIKKFQPFLQLREVLALSLQKAVGRLCAHTKFVTHGCLIHLDFWDVLVPKTSGHSQTNRGSLTHLWEISDWEHICMLDLQSSDTNSQPMPTASQSRSTGIQQAAWMSSS